MDRHHHNGRLWARPFRSGRYYNYINYDIELDRFSDFCKYAYKHFDSEPSVFNKLKVDVFHGYAGFCGEALVCAWYLHEKGKFHPVGHMV